MSFRRWLDERDPPPPAALAGRVMAAVEAVPPTGRSTVEVALDAGVGTLGTLLRNPNATRPAAIDLLAADALVTYAFEAAAESAVAIDGLAGDAMARIARLAEEVGR